MGPIASKHVLCIAFKSQLASNHRAIVATLSPNWMVFRNIFFKQISGLSTDPHGRTTNNVYNQYAEGDNCTFEVASAFDLKIT